MTKNKFHHDYRAAEPAERIGEKAQIRRSHQVRYNQTLKGHMKHMNYTTITVLPSSHLAASAAPDQHSVPPNQTPESPVLVKSATTHPQGAAALVPWSQG